MEHAEIAWHALDADEVLGKLDSNAGGLDAAEAERRLARFGPNRLERRPPRSALRILAAQFESFVLPVVVLLAVPLSLIGAILLLAVTGNGLDTMSLIGIVVLAGIAVNNAILMVDAIGRGRADGMPQRAAIEAAGRARLRPIVMTSSTTILGLLPMAVGLGSGAELRAPLAVAVIGGMATSTVLVLIVVPVVYQRIAGGRA